QYYPATFFLYESPQEEEISLPAEYGYVQEGETVTAGTPDGRTLVRYQIQPENFSSDAKYKDAIQNFANWFTYYRKRHLATRGALMHALENLNGIRVGVTTTNQRQDFKMYALGSGDPDGDGDSARSDLYDVIEKLDFSKERSSPNRKGLQFAGMQLESNTDIITNACQPNYAMLVTDGYNR